MGIKVSQLPVAPSIDTAAAFHIVKDGVSYQYPASSLLPHIDASHVGALVSNDNGTGTANVATINAALVAANAASVALTGAVEVRLPAGFFYINGTIVVPRNVTLSGAGMDKTTLYMPASSYPNTTVNVYGSTSVAIDISGEISGDFTASQQVTLHSFTIRAEAGGARYLYPITARNIGTFEIHHVEIFGVPIGTCIVLDSARNGSIHHCHIHDCTTAESGATQLSGIEADGNRVNGVNCSAVKIYNNHIADLTMTGAALPSTNMQTDGINTGVGTTHGLQIFDNYIKNVGEGIDCFSSECIIHGNELIDCYNVGIKLIHSASRCQVYGNTIMRPGLAGIYMGSSNSAGHTERNYVHGNLIHDVGYGGVWAAGSVVGLYINNDDPHTYQPRYNTFRDNRITGGADMKRAIQVDDTEAVGNCFYDTEVESYTVEYSYDGGTDTIITNAKKTLVRASVGSTQGTTGGAEETVEFNTEEIDAQSEFNTGTYTFTANSPRTLRVYAQVGLNAVALTSLKIRKNGTTRAQYVSTAALEVQTACVSDTFKVAIGDTIDIRFLNGSGNRDIVATASLSYLTIEEVAC
jgi:hypothetical protein